MKYKSKVIGLSTQEINSLKPEEVDAFFELGKQWDLAPVLKKGGAIIFPHTLITTVGDYTAAVVDAVLNSGAKHVIVLGVLHSLDRAHLIEARAQARRGEDVSNSPYRGIFGPKFPGDQTWRSEYSLESFIFLWNQAIQKRGLKNPPELIVAYPCLSNNDPGSLRGMEQLKLEDSVIIATVDFCHHGVAYPTTLKPIIPLSNEAEIFATQIIEEGFEIIQQAEYAAFTEYCSRTVCDGTDVIQVLMHLLGPLKGHIVDIRLIDTAHLFEGDPSPTWVAATLIALERS